MYTWQFVDGSWRIAAFTNSRFECPLGGAARELWETPYTRKSEAEAAIALLRIMLG